MDCPRCSGPTRVLDSRPQPNASVRRRRECLQCEHRFTTHERKALELAGAVRADVDRHEGETAV